MAPRGGGLDAETRQLINDIRLEDIDFEKVAACNDKHVLQRYIKLLNDDGAYFVDLLNAVKKKLLEVAPKEYYLLYPRVASAEEVNDATQDLLDWEMNVKETDKALLNARNSKDNVFDDGSRTRAPIRGQENAIARPNLTANKQLENDRDNGPKTGRDAYARDKTKMKDYYTAWDRYDVDSVEEAIDREMREEDEARLKHFEDMKEEQESVNRASPINVAGLPDNVPDAHRKHMADNEKEKGNEAFYAKDYAEAEAYYSRSLHFCPGDHATWANRALVRLKLENAQGAVEDCEHALAICPKYMKGLHRKGKALYELKRYEEAVQYFQLALAESPGNSQINGDLMVARRQLRSPAEEVSKPVSRNPRDAPRTVVEELPDDPPTTSSRPATSDKPQAGYTRIEIEEDSESESGEDVPISAANPAAAGGGGFRKVVIEEVSGSEDEADEAPPVVVEKSKPASPSKAKSAPAPISPSAHSGGFHKVTIIEEDSDAGTPPGAKSSFQPPPRVEPPAAAPSKEVDTSGFDDMD